MTTIRMPIAHRSLLLAASFALAQGTAARAAESTPIDIHRSELAIEIDGALGDPGWEGATRIDTWFETRPGDNIEPKVKNVAWMTYDERYLYAAFEYEDPEPGKIRAPYANRDNVPSYTDYGGLIIDANNDGRTAQMFLANPRGIQYDALTSDAADEDSSPDFFWDSAGQITEHGWTLEIRIPFASLRYPESNPEQWGILLYRNRPREFRYQYFTSRLPRDSTCFICNVRPLTGLADLPGGSHYVIAPYASGNQLSRPENGLGSPLESGNVDADAGLDVKWLPNPNTVVDAAINPDFSQIESDVAQVTANERFALFFDEKRPFFLEGSDLFSTPLQAVYTRTVTSPRWGTRVTGQTGANTYTLLVAEDRGGGSTVLPGPTGSRLARQDFESRVAIGRWRHDLGRSFVSFLASTREIDGGGSNRVFGPDFRWQASDQDVISGQFLLSTSQTPERPDLADEWDGRELSGHAARLWWYRQLSHWDFYTDLRDISDDFRADNGFMPQVGYRRLYGELGYTLYPEDKPISRIRPFLFAEQKEDQDGRLLFRNFTPGFGGDAIWNSFMRLELRFDEVLAIDKTFDRNWLAYSWYFTPSRRFTRVELDVELGDQVDFANDRKGDGTNITLYANIRPTDHLELRLDTTRRWLDVTNEQGLSGRLFTADVARLRATYTFNDKSWLRWIGQWVETERMPELYTFEVDESDAEFASSLVFAYKVNWQTVLFAGYSDNRIRDEMDQLEPDNRQLFVKVSYAFQR
jgi:hypothetical protein